MTERGWRDRIVGARMRVDQEFAGTVQSSGFSRSEWGMIMTAVDFEVEGEGESARLVADTSRIDVILPELDDVAEQMGGAPGRSPGSRSGSGLSDLFGGGLVESLRSSLGLGGGGSVDPERRREAIRLADEYASALQRHLEESGRWEDIRELAAEQDAEGAGQDAENDVGQDAGQGDGRDQPSPE